MPDSQTILILGASRGLGLGLVQEFLARGWRVVATVRGSAERLEALARGEGALRIETLDVTDAPAAAALAVKLAPLSLDMLFVNAGVVDDKRPAMSVTTDAFIHLMVTNALSPIRMIAAFESLVRPDGVIGVMSSGLGSVANNTGGGWDAYRASKAALNTLLRSHAAQARDGRAYLSIAPGWVRTDMGGAGAGLDVETAMRGVAEVLVSHLGQPGSAYLDYKGRALAW